MAASRSALLAGSTGLIGRALADNAAGLRFLSSAEMQRLGC